MAFRSVKSLSRATGVPDRQYMAPLNRLHRHLEGVVAKNFPDGNFRGLGDAALYELFCHKASRRNEPIDLVKSTPTPVPANSEGIEPAE